MNKPFVLGVLAAATLASAATAQTHGEYLAAVASYKPMAAFDHEVAGAKFVGYFLAAPDRCDVTVFEARADDEAQAFAPRRIVLQIAAGGRSELPVGPDAALAIACDADATSIKIAPQMRRLRSAQL